MQVLVTYIRRLDGQDEIPSSNARKSSVWASPARWTIFLDALYNVVAADAFIQVGPTSKEFFFRFSTNIQNFRINSELKNRPDSLIPETW